MMRQAHKYAAEITHWLNGGAIQYIHDEDCELGESGWSDCDECCVNFDLIGKFRIKPQPEIPKTRITESDYNFYKERIQSKLHPDHTTFFMMQKVMIEIAQESLRLAVENGDLIIPTK